MPLDFKPFSAQSQENLTYLLTQTMIIKETNVSVSMPKNVHFATRAI